MATISSHVLDSVIGSHAAGIQVQCYRRSASGEATLLFDKSANEQGRVSEAIDMPQSGDPADVELVFHSRQYFETQSLPDDGYQIMNVVVVRLSLPDPHANYHVPVMLAPHSYSVWWSGATPDAT